MREALEAPFWSYEDLALFIGSVIPCGFAGAVLVRPDGFVAWRARSTEEASAGTISRALASLLSLRLS